MSGRFLRAGRICVPRAETPDPAPKKHRGPGPLIVQGAGAFLSGVVGDAYRRMARGTKGALGATAL